MQVSQDVLQRNSQQELATAIHTLSDAGAGVIHIRTGEINRALAALRLAITVDDAVYKEWDIVNGWRQFDIQSRKNPDVPGDKKVNLVTEIQTPDAARTAAKTQSGDGPFPMQFFVFVQPQYWAENNPAFTHMILHYATELPATDVRVILVTPDAPLPANVSDSVTTVRFNPPGHEELMKSLNGILDDLSEEVALTDEEKNEICFQGAGMSAESFEMYASVAIVEANNARETDDEDLEITSDTIKEGINDGKTAVVNRTDLLELYQVEDMSDVGGLALLKEWVQKRRVCFTEVAAEFGIEAPKGIVFVGPPGTGKSLTAKAVAGVLGVPLIRLDFGKVFQSLVGSSEERIRTALTQVSYMAPCVLFVDEIDKGLGGIGTGGGDSGTSSRVLGTFLTWLNDNQAPVFTMVTANNIDGLPPELMRKGRFDEIFASGFPDYRDRKEIMGIHLRRRGWDIDDIEEDTLDDLLDACNGFAGAEIEAGIKEGLIDAFYADSEIDHAQNLARYIKASYKGTVCLAKAYKTQIQNMTVWAKQNARPAALNRGEPKREEVKTQARARVRQRARKTDAVSKQKANLKRIK